VASLGAGSLLFQHVFGFAAMDFSVPLMGFVFLVALGVDYNIFLLTRVREEAAWRGHRQGPWPGCAAPVASSPAPASSWPPPPRSWAWCRWCSEDAAVPARAA
jgi:MMPL family